MATDENNHKNEARDDWTGCTFRVERGPSSEGRAWGMADILTDVPRRVWPARPGFLPRRPARDRARPRGRLTPPAQAFAGHAEDHWINVVTSQVPSQKHTVTARSTRHQSHASIPSPADVRDMTSLERRLIDDDDGAAPASHYLPSILIATDAGATTVAPPGRAARERGRPALCANVLDEFVRAPLPQLDLTSGGPARGLHAPPGPNGLLRGRHVPPALLPPHRPLTYPACRFLFPPALIRSSQSTRDK